MASPDRDKLQQAFSEQPALAAHVLALYGK
jgi:hypothetical protein